MKSLLTGLVVLLTALYPLAVYYGLERVSPRLLGGVLMVLVVLRLLAWGGPVRQRVRTMLPLLLGMGATTLLLLVSNSAIWLLLYPLSVSVVFLVVFAGTLLRPPTMAERFARLNEPDLPPRAVRYCRRVTLVWCGFFILNGSLSFVTVVYYWQTGALGPWTIYNGLLSYLAMGLLSGAEYLVRRRVRAAHAADLRPEPLT